MTHTTQRVFDTIQRNGLAVQVRRGAGDTHVSVYDQRTRTEHAFAFNSLSEDWVVQDIAERFCTIDQQDELLGLQLLSMPSRLAAG